METNVQTTDITNLLNLTIEINNTIQKNSLLQVCYSTSNAGGR